MKRFLALLILGSMLNSCDDGDLVFEDVNLNDVTPANCNNIIYKLGETQVKLIEIANLSTYLPTQEAVVSLDVNANNRVIYRLYNGSPTADNICETIQPGTPTIAEQWDATGGTIEINTTLTKSENQNEGFEGGEIITGLQHRIRLVNMFYQTGSGVVMENSEDFGIYTQTPYSGAPNLTFGIDSELETCDGNVFYNKTLTRAIKVAIDPAVLNSLVLDEAQTINISDLNTVTYSVYSTEITNLTPEAFCPLLPITTETWNGVSGDGANGLIKITKVETSSGSTDLKYSIHLINTSLQRGTNSYKIADDYFVGDYFL